MAQIICMDLLNYNNEFFDIPDRRDPYHGFVDFEKDMENAKKKVNNFIHASIKSGFQIIGFIDKSISTEETMKKWRTRRTKELTSGKKMVMPNMPLIIGSIFQSFGVTVHFSTVDCDMILLVPLQPILVAMA